MKYVFLISRGKPVIRLHETAVLLNYGTGVFCYCRAIGTNYELRITNYEIGGILCHCRAIVEALHAGIFLGLKARHISAQAKGLGNEWTPHTHTQPLFVLEPIGF